MALRSGSIDPATFTVVRLFSGAIILFVLVGVKNGHLIIRLTTGKLVCVTADMQEAASQVAKEKISS